jgi:hypothetical protein
VALLEHGEGQMFPLFNEQIVWSLQIRPGPPSIYTFVWDAARLIFTGRAEIRRPTRSLDLTGQVKLNLSHWWFTWPHVRYDVAFRDIMIAHHFNFVKRFLLGL